PPRRVGARRRLDARGAVRAARASTEPDRLCQLLRRSLGDLLAQGFLRAVHGTDRDPGQDRTRRLVCQAQGAVQSRNYEWDVVNLGDVEYAQAVHEGLLEKVDRVAARADQLPPQIVRDYGITSYSLGTNIVY